MINQFDDRPLSLLDIAGFDKPKSVDTFADLPPANENLDEKYFVNKDTGVYLINKKYAGIYISNGTTWDLLEAGAFSDFDNKYVLQNTIIAINKGGTGATTSADARVNLGATTLGSNLFTITNPSAISFLRINADNSISALNQVAFQTAIGASATATANTLVLRDSAGSFLATNGGFSGQMAITRAWDAALFKGQLFLAGATGNRIDWTPAGLAAPATTTRSVGTKLNFYPNVSATNIDYAIGLETNYMWYSVPSTTQGFKWYFGPSNVATLTSSGLVCGSFSTGGTSSQFLKADGSVDATSYLPLTGGVMSGAITFAGNQTWPTWSITQGGTGAQNVSDARTNLGLGTSAILNAGVSNGVATLDGSGTIPLSQIPSNLQGALQYIGTWNAASNNPILTSSVGTKGFYYVVNFAGSTTLNGINDWKINDWAIFNGSVWEKIDNTDSVISVNGFNGTVNLTTTNINEGTNAYYTDIRARNSINSSATGLTYTNSTGAFTLTSGYAIPTTTSQSNWDTAYNNRITSLTTTGNSGAATLISNVLNIPNYASGLPLTGGTLTGDLFLSVTGSSTASPRTIGMSNFNTGTAAKFQFGDPLNSIQVSHGGRMSMQSYWGIEIYGGRQNGTTPLGFTSGATTDASLLVGGTVVANPVLVAMGANGQTGDLQQWRNNAGTVLSYVNSAGVIGASEVNSFNTGTTTTAAANIRLTNNNGNGGGLALFGGSYTTSGVKRAGGTYIYSNQGGGLTLNAEGNNSLYLATNSNTALTINGSQEATFNKKVFLTGSTTNSSLQINGLELQGYSTTNVWVASNTYHNGTNHVTRVAGRGSQVQMVSGEILLRTSNVDVAAGGTVNFIDARLDGAGNLTTAGDIIGGTNKIIRQNQNYSSTSPSLQVGDANYGFSAQSSILYLYAGSAGYRFKNFARNADIVAIDDGGNLSLSGNININGGAAKRLDFASGSYAIPSTGIRSIGTKIVLWPDLTSTQVDYAIGISSGTLWNSVPNSGGAFRWYAGTTVVATLLGSGQFSAPNIDAGQNLSYNGTLYASGPAEFGGYNYGNGRINMLPSSTGSTKFIDFWRADQGAQVGSISTNGTNTFYNNSSDYRLKYGVKPIENASERVMRLKPCTYRWKTDDTEGEGFIAHEFLEVVPYAVTGKKDAINEDGTINTQQIDPSKMIALLTASLQDALKRIENLEKLIDKQNEKT
jgi:hypothetical protein